MLEEIFENDPYLLLSSEHNLNTNYNYIKVKPATIKATPKGRRYIKADRRIYLPSLNNFSSLTDGTTYIFNDTGTKVKRIKNYL